MPTGQTIRGKAFDLLIINHVAIVNGQRVLERSTFSEPIVALPGYEWHSYVVLPHRSI